MALRALFCQCITVLSCKLVDRVYRVRMSLVQCERLVAIQGHGFATAEYELTD